MHLKISSGRYVDGEESKMIGSTMSSPFPFFQFLHTCGKRLNHFRFFFRVLSAKQDRVLRGF